VFVHKESPRAALADIDRFDAVIDVRSPGEFALDHLPGAQSCPVLDDEERIRVGTTYKQVSPFDAKKIGAALVSKNIARHIEERFSAKPREWRPLVYCWRGGTRSGAMAHILREVGWQPAQLDGGYRAYRREVRAQLEVLPQRLRLRVVCGATGSGKSRLLEALAAAGSQVLHLEAIARHRGSVLGDLPGEPQPSQKMFDSLLWDALRRFDPAQPVFVEAESRKIGRLQLPPALLQRMRAGKCVRIEVPLAERVRFLMAEYRHFVEQPALLGAQLACLLGLYGHQIIDRWAALAGAGAWQELVGELLIRHYDPAYLRAASNNYAHYPNAPVLTVERLDHAGVSAAAAELFRQRRPLQE